MNDFKPGDRVEYVGGNRPQTGALIGEKGVVIEMSSTLSVKVKWDRSPRSHGVLMANLHHVTPAPEVLTIPRAELPEVVERDGLMRADGLDYGPAFNATQHRKRALAQLAVSEFLAAREKAEQDAADQHAAILNKRRDELAVEVAKAAGFIDFLDFTYKEHLPSAQAAINMLIERDGQVKK